MKTATTEEFIAKAICVHGQKYTYDKTNYIGQSTKIKIICQIHGEFSQFPNNHLSGSGCSKCGYEKLSKQFSSNKNAFILKANIIHNYKFNYEKINYTKTHSKIEIICNVHGSWFVTPANHLTGYGCPKCGLGRNISKTETLWLDSLLVPEEFRHQTIKINNKRIIADAYDPKTNTVYEFLGDFYHGNPKRFNGNEFNPKLKLTYGELYLKTLERLNAIVTAGYNLITIWELDWRQI